MSAERLNAALALARGTTILQDDEDVALRIMYVGDKASATIEVAAGGDVTFKHGVLSSEANDTTIGGAGDGGATLDVSEATEDTLGECIDLINGSPNWRAEIVAGLRADSSDDTLLLRSETTLVPFVPVELKWDTSEAFMVSHAVSLRDLGKSAQFRPGGGKGYGVLDTNTMAAIYGLSGFSTYGSGTSLFQVYSILTDAQGGITSETKIFEEAAGATTVNAAATIASAIKPASRELGYKLLARLKNSAACATATLRIDSAVINALLA